MAMISQAIEQTELTSISDVQEWIRDTQSHLQRVSLGGVLGENALFHDDEYFGDGDVMWRFNERGIRALCQRIGFRFDQLGKLETPTLASQVLNDLIQQKEVLAKLAEYEFVLDDRTNTVIGIVSRTYISYTNEQFLTDMNDLLTRLAKDDTFQFHNACGINTELTVRFRSEKRHGTIKGRTGLAEDRTEFGLDFQNSMVGTSSVRINYFLYRLVCANGMMVPAATSINRVFHSGNRETFKYRLTRSFSEVLRKLDSLQSMLISLGSLAFDPGKLAQNEVACRQTFAIIPALKQKISERERLQLRYPSGASEADKRKMRLEHDTEIVALIPKYFGGNEAGRVFSSHFREGASMFDFLNVFTEHAKNCSPGEKLDIEEKAGTLAKYIAENARKF